MVRVASINLEDEKMSNTPDDLRYTKSHEWVRRLPDGTLEVGITDHAQDLLGDIVFIELPEEGASVQQGKECAVIESVKAASDIYAPLDGEVVSVNGALVDAPETVNSDPYADGWMFRIKPAEEGAFEALLDSAAYQEVIVAEAH
jgi:glycine cleavage system H protein